jgi:hypothetical protein
MKKILTVLLWALSVQLVAQNLQIITGITINLPAFPDPNTANWGTATSMFTIQASTSERTLKEAMSSTILVTIKKGESKACGTYTNQNAPASSFNKLMMIWAGKNAVSLLGQECMLTPGEYRLCVQFFLKGRQASEEFCKAFTIKAPETTSYQPPQAIAPANGTVISEADAKKPVTFRWTPVTPKPRESVLYRLRIFEIRQGQTAASAVKSAAPLHEKEITNQTQYILPSLSLLTIAKGSSYSWYIQAVDPKGTPVGGNNGMSVPVAFSIGGTNIPVAKAGANTELKMDSAICLPKMNGLFRYHIWAHYQNFSSSSNNILVNDNQYFGGYPANNNPGNGINLRNNIRLKTGVYNNSLTISDGIEATPGTINNISPAANTWPALLNPGNVLSFQFDYSTSNNAPVQFTFYGLVDDSFKDKPNRNARNESADLVYPPCPCTACDTVQMNIPEQGTLSMDSTLWLQTPVNVYPGSIKTVKAQLVYFYYKPESDDCVPCNRDSRDWGNFIVASLSDNEFPLNGQLTHGHEVQWTALNAGGASMNGNFNFHISLPPLVKCCKLEVKFCIRYLFEFTDCSVCEKVVCYSYSKTSK